MTAASVLVVTACSVDIPDRLDNSSDDGVGDGGDTFLTEGTKTGISGLKAVRNPDNHLSCYVEWSTDVPSFSTVEFGEEGYQFRIHQGEAVTEHKVLVIGMHEETEYRIRVVSETKGGVKSAETTFTTGTLPDVVPRPELGAHDPGAAEVGWTLLNVSDIFASPAPPMVAVMYDFEGLPVWYHINGDTPDNHGDTPVNLLEDDTLTIGATAGVLPPREIDLAGNVLWEGPPQAMRSSLTHHFEKLPDGNYVALKEIYQSNARGDMVEMFRPDHSVIWSWNTFDYVDWAPVTPGDWSHCNSVTVDLDESVFYLSCRNFSNVLKVSLEGDMEIIWRLGKGGDFAADPASDMPWFEEQHEPELQPNGNFLIYDNGTLERGASRVVEYAIDKEAATSTIVWEFPGDFDVDPWYRTEWFTNHWGDADRLPNDNTLVTAGNIPQIDAPSRIFEVTPDGGVVWEIVFPNSGVYRAERLSPPPLIEPI